MKYEKKRENFKGSRGGGGSNGALVAGAGLGLMSTSGRNARCPLDDNSFFCQLNRFTSTLGMLIYILVVFAILAYVIYLVYAVMTGKKNLNFF